MTTGERLRQLRREKGWSQEQLSRLANVPLGSLNRYERNVFEPSLSRLRSLAKALDVDLDTLAGQENQTCTVG